MIAHILYIIDNLVACQAITPITMAPCQMCPQGHGLFFYLSKTHFFKEYYKDNCLQSCGYFVQFPMR